MSKIASPARIVVTRTAVVESLLQEIWHLNPDIKGKISMTVVMAFRALIKECTREQASFAAEVSRHQIATGVVQREEGSPYSAVQVVKDDKSPDQPHPDSAWD